MSGPQGGRHGEDGVLDLAFFIITLGYQAMRYVIRMALMDSGIEYLLFWDGLGPLFCGDRCINGVLVLV
jgi:hypothetical protein